MIYVYICDDDIDIIIDLLLKKVTDFVPYIDNNVKLFSNKKDINISGIDNNKIKNIYRPKSFD